LHFFEKVVSTVWELSLFFKLSNFLLDYISRSVEINISRVTVCPRSLVTLLYSEFLYYERQNFLVYPVSLFQSESFPSYTYLCESRDIYFSYCSSPGKKKKSFDSYIMRKFDEKNFKRAGIIYYAKLLVGMGRGGGCWRCGKNWLKG